MLVYKKLYLRFQTEFFKFDKIWKYGRIPRFHHNWNNTQSILTAINEYQCLTIFVQL